MHERVYFENCLPPTSVRMYPSIRSHGPPDLTSWEHRKPETGDQQRCEGP